MIFDDTINWSIVFVYSIYGMSLGELSINYNRLVFLWSIFVGYCSGEVYLWIEFICLFVFSTSVVILSKLLYVHKTFYLDSPVIEVGNPSSHVFFHEKVLDVEVRFELSLKVVIYIVVVILDNEVIR